MNVTLHPSTVDGIVEAPPSKSMTQRAMAASLLAGGESLIINASECNDAKAVLAMAEVLGAEISRKEGALLIRGGREPRGRTLHCGESGLAMRLFAPIAALMPGPFTFTGEGSLLNRPVQMIGDAIEQLGAGFSCNNNRLPFTVSGLLNGGQARIDGAISSQILSGLLMALPLALQDSEITVENLKSRLYIDMTMKVLRHFRIRVEHEDYRHFTIPGNQQYYPCEYFVEGDWSGAAFLMVAAAITGDISIKGLDVLSPQADLAVLEALKRAGATIAISGDNLMVSAGKLSSFEFDASSCPDLFPPLAALAAYCNGTSVISGIGRLVYKESNRAESISHVLEATGIRVDLLNDEMHIHGGRPGKATVNTFNDHRIVMMASVLALGAVGAVTVTGAECVDKSFPGFFETLQQAGVRLEIKH